MQVDRLRETLEQFVNSEDWDEAQHTVKDNPALLSDEAQELLKENIADYRETGRDDVANYLEEHRAILQRSREVGIPQAFREAQAAARKMLEARQRQLETLRPARPDPMQSAVWQLLQAETPEEIDDVLSKHPTLTRNPEVLAYLQDLTDQASKAGYTEAVRFLREYHELLQTFREQPPLMRAIQEFITVPTWQESAEAIKNNPELLEPEALALMDGLIDEAETQGDENTAEVLRAYRQILERSRQVGPDRAIEEIVQARET